MSNFASDNYASDDYRALTWGLPGALTFPAIDPLPSGATPAVGWYASDNGLVRRRGGFIRKDSQDFRRFYLDLSPLTEIRAGDTIGEVADVHLLAAPDTISAGNFAVDVPTNRVYFTLEGGVPNSLYAIRVQCKLTSLTVIARVVRVVVDEYV